MISNEKMKDILDGIFDGISHVDLTKKEKRSVDITLDESERGYVTLGIKFSSFAGHTFNMSLKLNKQDPDAFPEGDDDVQQLRDGIAEFALLRDKESDNE